jgi:Nitroreductase family
MVPLLNAAQRLVAIASDARAPFPVLVPYLILLGMPISITSESKGNGHIFIPLQFASLPMDEQRARAQEFESPRDLIEAALRVASLAPSGVDQESWRFVVVSAGEIKRKIRLAAEEKENYERRFPQEWLDALAALKTDWHKGFLEIAPWADRGVPERLWDRAGRGAEGTKDQVLLRAGICRHCVRLSYHRTA